jgi:putative ABC transport system permease protein
MGAVRTKVTGDLRRRRLQAFVIGFVLLLASAAGALALGILVESHAPFEAAFNAANGAHLVIDYRAGLDADALRATGSAPGVTAAAGPWPVVQGAVEHPKGGLVFGDELSGRPAPDPSIDAVTVLGGRWWQAPGEIVLDQDIARMLGMGVGSRVTIHPVPPADKSGAGQVAAQPGVARAVPGPSPQVQPGGAQPGEAPSAITMTVVGIAASVSTPDVAGWMSPQDVAAIATPQHPALDQMLYRVDPAANASDIGAALGAITRDLPADAVESSHSYLDVETGVNRLADLYVPVLLAFSLFALLAAAFTIANVVSGIVLTGYRDIGVMKAVGYTPAQVVTILLGQVLAPVVIGSVAGVIIGTIASFPIVRDTAESFGLPASASIAWSVVAGVPILCVAVAVIASIVPAVQAGRLSPVTAIAHGAAPSGRPDGGRLRRLGLRLPLSLPARLGVAAGLAHPGRALMTLGALLVGVAAVAFALGLNLSLLRVMEDLNRPTASPVRAEAGGPASPAAVTAAFASSPWTGRFVSIGQTSVGAPRLSDATFVGYQGDTSWLGYRLIEGRWSTSPGEAVAPTNLFTVGGLQVGDALTLDRDGRTVTVRLVGEIFDTARERDDDLVIRGSWADLVTLEPSAQADAWEAAPADGVAPRTYLESIQATVGGMPMWVEQESSSDTSFVLFLTVVGVLGVVLVVMSVGGVLNTVMLETRQRTHELAVLRTLGLGPRGVVGMVLWSIAPLAVAAGVIGLPLGLAAQRAVLTYMGQVAAKLAIPDVTFDVFPLPALVLLGLAGLAIGIAGAWLPAQRAARARIAPVLQAE